MKRTQQSIQVKQRRTSSQTKDGESKPSTSTKPSVKGIKRKINDIDIPSETVAVPWEKTIPSSPRKTTWMIQEIYEQSKENKRMFVEMLRVLNKKSFRDDSSEEEQSEEDYYNEKEVTFPLKNMKDLKSLEERLKEDPVYGSRIMNMELLMLGGSENASKFVCNILKFLLTDEVAANFMFTGAEAPFKNFKSLLLFEVVTRAVKKKFKTIEDKVIFNETSKWLENCKMFQRCAVCSIRRNRSGNKLIIH